MLRTALLCSALLCTTVFAQTAKTTQPPASPSAAASATTDLPVKRVVLYKNGVGYFEHAGKVRGTQEMRIQFTTGQLNDVLKSLTVVDLGGGQITGVRYDSIAPLSERLATLRVQLGENTNRIEFLRALRGARVEVRSGTTSASGRLLSVETVRKETEKGQLIEATQFGVMTDGGELRTFELNPSTSVRIAEPELNREIGQYLNAVSSVRAKDVRRMNFTSVGNGDRDVFVSYISEVPVWKSTYRIVMPKDTAQKPLLQGWAIIDNTVGEDWKDVQLSLVAGAPQSFIQQISQPYYVRRPSVDLPKSAMLSPQSHEGTLMNYATAPPPPPPPGTVGTCSLWGVVTDAQGTAVSGAKVTVRNETSGTSQSTVSDAGGIYRINGVEAGNTALFVEAAGFQRFQLTNIYLGVGRTNEISARLAVGNSEQSVEVTSAAPLIDVATSMVSTNVSVDIGERIRKMEAEAEANAVGDLFQYNIKQKTTVLKNQSALVPIVQATIEADKVTVWNDTENTPLRALWIKNTSGLTLDAGSFNIVDGGSFSGEGVIEELHPNERRLISYAADNAVRILADSESDSRPATHIRVGKGVMKLTREDRETKTYVIHNSDMNNRQVVIEHPAREGWKLKDLKPEESSSSFHRFRIQVDAGKTATLKVEEFHPLQTSYVLTDLDEEELLFVTTGRTVNPAIESALKSVLLRKNQISEVRSGAESRRMETQRISAEQARLRENMKALKGSSEEKALLQRYVQNLNQQEDRLAVLNREITDMEGQVRKLSVELNEMAQSITFDEDI